MVAAAGAVLVLCEDLGYVCGFFFYLCEIPKSKTKRVLVRCWPVFALNLSSLANIFGSARLLGAAGESAFSAARQLGQFSLRKKTGPQPSTLCNAALAWRKSKCHCQTVRMELTIKAITGHAAAFS